jgi:hypothetical protein
MKTLYLVAELFLTDGRTDILTYRQRGRHDEANSRFSQFCQSASYSFIQIDSFVHIAVLLKCPQGHLGAERVLIFMFGNLLQGTESVL